MSSRVLPFARGTTLCDGQATPADGNYKAIVGQVFEVWDAVNKYGTPLKLRAVEADEEITVTSKCVSFTVATQEDYGRKVTAADVTAGKIGKPIDPEYVRLGVSTIPNYDVFWVVEEGDVEILTSSSNSVTAGCALQISNATGVVDIAADKDVVIGTALEAAATSATCYVTMHVNAGLNLTQSSI